ncbi:galactose oxidase [Gigaspora margarita]|uniref:Galactose oxidase n=1 Tax=Gigaspora margarita TaxID=4874 RepID=A0A8H3XKC4_GIGMA|nr:galactose oxidase [Gigaspora margarita]
MLDMSRRAHWSFNIVTPPWRKDKEMPIAYMLGSSCVSTINNSIVYLVGGRMFIPNTTNLTYTSSTYVFNSNISQWTIPNITGFNSSFTRRDQMQAIINNNEKIFILGGIDFISVIRYNDINIFDTTTMSWLTLPQSSRSLQCSDYAAILLPNSLIIYIGGRLPNGSHINMNQIQIFDTKFFTWSTNTTSGSNVRSRAGHSAVLTQNGDIILYGGATMNSTGSLISVLSDIAVLNTDTWKWFIPDISGSNVPPPLAFHSAALYLNYMILAFGQTAISQTHTNNIYILNIHNYTWIATVDIPTTTTTTAETPTDETSDNQQNNNNILYIGIGIGVGGIVLTGILLTAGLLIYKNHDDESTESSEIDRISLYG